MARLLIILLLLTFQGQRALACPVGYLQTYIFHAEPISPIPEGAVLLRVSDIAQGNGANGFSEHVFRARVDKVLQGRLDQDWIEIDAAPHNSCGPVDMERLHEGGVLVHHPPAYVVGFPIRVPLLARYTLLALDYRRAFWRDADDLEQAREEYADFHFDPALALDLTGLYVMMALVFLTLAGLWLSMWRSIKSGTANP